MNLYQYIEIIYTYYDLPLFFFRICFYFLFVWKNKKYSKLVETKYIRSGGKKEKKSDKNPCRKQRDMFRILPSTHTFYFQL